jgi:hypothetical protein
MSSPFRLTVLPGNPDPETTYAYGQGLIQSIAGGVGGYSQFTIRSRDMYGNRYGDHMPAGMCAPMPSVGGLRGAVLYLQAFKWDRWYF